MTASEKPVLLDTDFQKEEKEKIILHLSHIAISLYKLHEYELYKSIIWVRDTLMLKIDNRLHYVEMQKESDHFP